MPEWLGGEEKGKKRLEGERVSVLESRRDYSEDPGLKSISVKIPAPEENKVWIGNGFNSNALPISHVSLAGSLSDIKEFDVGEGAPDDLRLIAEPIIVENKLVLIDGENNVRAFNLEDLQKPIWSIPYNKNDYTPPGGGLAYGNGIVYATIADGDVIAIDITNGKELWRKSLNQPVRSRALVTQDKLFVATAHNQLYALKRQDGSLAWNHTNIAEPTKILGSSSPSLFRDLVMASFSSGEIIGFKVDSGEIAFGLTLTNNTNPGSLLTSIGDIPITPVIDDTVMFASSHAGSFWAVNLEKGQDMWQRPIALKGNIQLAGDFIYTVTTDHILLCLHKFSGAIKWARELPKYRKPDKKKDRIGWYGPVLAGDRLLIARSDGRLLLVSPIDGSVKSELEFDHEVFMKPLVAHNAVYLLASDGKLIIVR